MKRAVLLLALFLLLTISVSAGIVHLPLVYNRAPTVYAGVTSIVDGDTIWVDLDFDGVRDIKVRYIGIDTPETCFGVECYGYEAKERNRQWIGEQHVRLEKDVSETDRYGRLLRYVYLADGTFVNAVLVEEGYAQAAVYAPDRRYESLFASLQEQAMIANACGWAACGW